MASVFGLSVLAITMYCFELLCQVREEAGCLGSFVLVSAERLMHQSLCTVGQPDLLNRLKICVVSSSFLLVTSQNNHLGEDLASASVDILRKDHPHEEVQRL